MNKKEQQKFQSLQKWLDKKLAHFVKDNTCEILWDGEDPGFVSLGYESDDEGWDICLHTLSGNTYSIASGYDCEGMTITEIKDDLKQRIEVRRVVEWT